MKMESKEYFEKVMQDYNQHRNGRSLRKYYKDEAIDYDWGIKYKKTYPVRSTEKEEPSESFVPISVAEEPSPALEWSVEHLVLPSDTDTAMGGRYIGGLLTGGTGFIGTHLTNLIANLHFFF